MDHRRRGKACAAPDLRAVEDGSRYAPAQEELLELRIPSTVTYIEDGLGSLPFADCGGARRTGQFHYEKVEVPSSVIPTYGSDSEMRYVHGDDVEIYDGYAVKLSHMEEVAIPEYENGPYGDLTLIANKGSYAEDYARRMGIRFRYAESSKPQSASGFKLALKQLFKKKKRSIR